jgi:hypothetical protein
MVAQAMEARAGGLPALQSQDDLDDMMTMDSAWMTNLNTMDWVRMSPVRQANNCVFLITDTTLQRFVDVSLAHSQTAGLNAEPGAGSTWMERMPAGGFAGVDEIPPLGSWS